MVRFDSNRVAWILGLGSAGIVFVTILAGQAAGQQLHPKPSVAFATGDGTNKNAAILPEGALAGFGRLPFQIGSRIHASELSPDGKLLATLSSRSATVWNTETGQPVYRFFFDVPSRPGYQRGLAFSPDSKRLACGPTSELIVVWDLASGKELRRFGKEFEAFDFSFFRFSADSTALIVESHNVVSWLNVETGATVRKLSGLRIKQLSPGDKMFAAVEDSRPQVQIGDAKTGKIVYTLSIAGERNSEPGGGMLSVLFLSDGVTLAVAHTQKSRKEDKADRRREVQFWDITTGKRRETTWSLITSDHIADRLALSPNGKVLYFEGNRFALETGKELEPIPLVYYTTAIFPHPDGKTLFAVGLEEIRRWDIPTGKQISKDKDFCRWLESAVSPDGRWLALRGAQYQGGCLELCDTGSGQAKHIAWPWGNGARITFTADSRSLIVNEYYHLQFLAVPKLAQGKKLIPAGKHDIQDASLHVSAAGRHLAVVGSTGLMRLFDLTTHKQVWSLEETRGALFTPDGKRLLGKARGTLRLHDLASKKVLYNVESPSDRGRRGAWISAWAFNPDGRVLAVAMTGGHICLLDAATGMERGRFLSMPTVGPFGFREYYQHATALAFSADGQWLAVGGDDGYLRIWEVSTRRELHRLHGHEGATQALGFSADGRRLVSFGDGEGLLWDLRPKKEKVKGPNPFADLLAKDGRTVYRAVWTLADDAKGPAKLREKISPKRVDARPARIAELITDLGAEQFKIRDQAMRSLAQLEKIARPALTEAEKKNPPLEVRRRIEKLLSQIDTPTEQALQISRALMAMELNGSDAARKLLQEWSQGTPGLRLTEEACAVLARYRTR